MHSEKETHGWDIFIAGHAPRSDSAQYVKSRRVLKLLAAAANKGMYGIGPVEDHHGGACWLWEHDNPIIGKSFFIRNLCGVEWSSQFCAAPEKIDLLRQNAVRLYDMFPRSIAKLDAYGCNATKLLATPIVDATGIANWVDSIFNASVPLPKAAHVGVLPPDGGYHHYPSPVLEIAFFKRDDFVLWVDDGSGVHVAVVPLSPPGSGDSRVAVLYAPPHSVLHAPYSAACKTGVLVVLPETHPLAQSAFALQVPANA